MKALLINPPKPLKESYSLFAFAAPKLPALGLAFIADIFSKHGWKTVFIDCVLEDMDHKELANIIYKERPDVIGLTVTTINYRSAQKVVRYAKKISDKIGKDILTIMGGAHPSGNPRRTLQETWGLDMVVFGEGEATISEVIHKLENGQKLSGIKGTAIRQGKHVKKNPERAYIRNLDDLSYPDMRRYISASKIRHTVARAPYKTLHLVSSRGCPFNCSFCEQNVFGRKWRTYSNKMLVSIIKDQKRKNNISHFSFEDDTFVLNPKRVIQFCDMLIKEDMGVSWSCSMRVDTITQDLMRKMAQSGCDTIYLGIERKDPEDLMLLNKKTQKIDIKKRIRTAKDEGINVFGSFILFIPTETRQKIGDIIRYSKGLGLDGAAFNTFTPYPHISMDKELLTSKGKVSDNYDDYSEHSPNPAYIPHGFSAKDIKRIQTRAYLSFYLSPRYVLTHLRRFLDPRLLKNLFRSFQLILYRG